jgi:hypothetical protein|mmetsp:Transcript_35276/g.6353  ORF Transcript_35276/g.6353 Transcript_35276/m.6353 type:complete len:161 (-) Transcript_35276:2210-2692(-)|eukprot:CAMPEP_0168314854 /NCGR_PEP_ID=MMETSP0210-20121227/9604_1 /TAXON_ID=40633 /ORGANISM="Condylostoma magnum, Strain COL2" /LENGTH=160 /DNA_ID=CAMNT_0008285321 /DNA_START=448 /DNA_END=930 /DNA_ORIENTATION=+
MIQDFQGKLESAGISGAVHSIGFGSGHDAEVLTEITKCGTRQGTFQFVPEGGRIPIAVNNVFELAFDSSVYAKFLGNNGQTVRKVMLEDSDDPAYYQASIYVTEDDTEEPKLELYNGEEVTVYDFELQSVDITDFKELVVTVANFVSHTIRAALDGKNSL